MTNDAPTNAIDVAVIGGGAAGLAAGVVLGRSRRTVTVFDAGEPRNAPADGIHAFLTRDGTPPREFLAFGRDEVTRYGGAVRQGPDAEVVHVGRDDHGFTIRSAAGDVVHARRVLLATGLVDELPDVPGVRDRWGRDVIHCPYCHGYEVRDQRIGVLVTGPTFAHQAKLFRQLSEHVVVLRNTADEFDADTAAELDALGIAVVHGKVTALEIADDRLTGVRLADGSQVALDTVVVAPRVVARSALLDALGLRAVPHPMGADVGMVVPTVDASGRTEVPGLWVAGNVTDPMAQVIAAAAQGNAAGAMINADLVEEDVRAAVARQSVSSTSRR